MCVHQLTPGISEKVRLDSEHGSSQYWLRSQVLYDHQPEVKAQGSSDHQKHTLDFELQVELDAWLLFVQIAKCICQNLQMYLSELKNVYAAG